MAATCFVLAALGEALVANHSAHLQSRLIGRKCSSFASGRRKRPSFTDSPFTAVGSFVK